MRERSFGSNRRGNIVNAFSISESFEDGFDLFADAVYPFVGHDRFINLGDQLRGMLRCPVGNVVGTVLISLI